MWALKRAQLLCEKHPDYPALHIHLVHSCHGTICVVAPPTLLLRHLIAYSLDYVSTQKSESAPGSGTVAAVPGSVRLLAQKQVHN